MRLQQVENSDSDSRLVLWMRNEPILFFNLVPKSAAQVKHKRVGTALLESSHIPWTVLNFLECLTFPGMSHISWNVSHFL